MALAGVKELVLNVEQPLELARTTSNATTEYWATYRRFIDNLRRRYPPHSAICPSLSFDIVLKSNSHQIKLRLDRCTFYLRGYRMETPQQWLEFGVVSSGRHPSDYVVAVPSLFERCFDYEHLERECGQKIESICLGKQQLTAAVDVLATSTFSPVIAKSLIVVGLMICEGIRFTQFCDYVAARFDDNLPIPRWMRRTLHRYFVIEEITVLDQCIRPDGENSDHDPRPSETISDDEALDGVDWYLSSEADNLGSGSGDKEISDANLMGHAPQTTNTDLAACDEEDYDCHHLGEGNSDILPIPFVGKPSDVSTDDEETPDVDPPVIEECDLCEFADIFFVRSDDEALDGVDWYLSSEADILDSGSGDEEIPDANLMGHAPQTTNTDLVACDEEDYDCHHPGEGTSDILPIPFAGTPSDISTDGDETPDVDSPVIRECDLCEFAEVFFVRVSNTEGMRPCSFYGTITVDEFGVPQNIYDRGPELSEFIQPGDLILLTGPVKPINVTYGFRLSLALMGESFRDFESFHAHIDEFDQLTYNEFYGEHCSLSVFYIAFKTAVRATLTVTFIDKDKEGHARVYGQISARCGKFGYEIVLFQRKAEEHMNVCPRTTITLLRNGISVPWDSRLVFRVDLFEYSESCFDQDIAKCVLEFPLEDTAGSKIMYRESGKIRVSVEWNCCRA